MSNLGSIKTIVIATASGAAITWAVLSASSNESMQRDQIASLEKRIVGLEALLTLKDEALTKARSRSWTSGSQTQTAALPSANNRVQQPGNNLVAAAPAAQDAPSDSMAIDSQQILRDLSTRSERDSRSFSTKVNELLAMNPSPENVAIVSQGVVGIADNPDLLPDHELEVLYQSQTNPEVKRVAAQVLSMRGDNTLIEKQISGADKALHSENAAERQQAVMELAKTRYAGAANAVAPLLQDSNIDVKMNALLALKATGNQSHIHLVESLAHSSDPNISWLANDVINSLQNLSDKARTRVTSSDAVAELPILAGQ